MKNRNSLVLGIIVLIFLFALVYVVVSHVTKIQEDVIVWEGPRGKYNIHVEKLENVTFYTITAVFNGDAYNYPLRSSPEQVKDIPLATNIVDNLLAKRLIYTTRDPELGNLTNQMSSIAALEFGRVLGTTDAGIYKKDVRAAFTEDTNTSSQYGIPVVTCEDVTGNYGVIYLKLGDTNQIYTEGRGCVIVQGKDTEGLIFSADRLTYALLGAM